MRKKINILLSLIIVLSSFLTACNFGTAIPTTDTTMLNTEENKDSTEHNQTYTLTDETLKEVLGNIEEKGGSVQTSTVVALNNIKEDTKSFDEFAKSFKESIDTELYSEELTFEETQELMKLYEEGRLDFTVTKDSNSNVQFLSKACARDVGTVIETLATINSNKNHTIFQNANMGYMSVFGDKNIYFMPMEASTDSIAKTDKDTGITYYNNVWENTDIELKMEKEKGIKEFLHIKDSTSPDSYSWLVSTDFDLSIDEFGNIIDKDNEFLIDRPWQEDAKGNFEYLDYELELLNVIHEKKTYKLSLKVNKSKDTVYPLLVDPTYNFETDFDKDTYVSYSANAKGELAVYYLTKDIPNGKFDYKIEKYDKGVLVFSDTGELKPHVTAMTKINLEGNLVKIDNEGNIYLSYPNYYYDSGSDSGTYQSCVEEPIYKTFSCYDSSIYPDSFSQQVCVENTGGSYQLWQGTKTVCTDVDYYYSWDYANIMNNTIIYDKDNNKTTKPQTTLINQNGNQNSTPIRTLKYNIFTDGAIFTEVLMDNKNSYIVSTPSVDNITTPSRTYSTKGVVNGDGNHNLMYGGIYSTLHESIIRNSQSQQALQITLEENSTRIKKDFEVTTISAITGQNITPTSTKLISNFVDNAQNNNFNPRWKGYAELTFNGLGSYGLLLSYDYVTDKIVVDKSFRINPTPFSEGQGAFIVVDSDVIKVYYGDTARVINGSNQYFGLKSTEINVNTGKFTNRSVTTHPLVSNLSIDKTNSVARERDVSFLSSYRVKQTDNSGMLNVSYEDYDIIDIFGITVVEHPDRTEISHDVEYNSTISGGSLYQTKKHGKNFAMTYVGSTSFKIGDYTYNRALTGTGLTSVNAPTIFTKSPLNYTGDNDKFVIDKYSRFVDNIYEEKYYEFYNTVEGITMADYLFGSRAATVSNQRVYFNISGNFDAFDVEPLGQYKYLISAKETGTTNVKTYLVSGQMNNTGYQIELLTESSVSTIGSLIRVAYDYTTKTIALVEFLDGKTIIYKASFDEDTTAIGDFSLLSEYLGDESANRSLTTGYLAYPNSSNLNSDIEFLATGSLFFANSYNSISYPEEYTTKSNSNLQTKANLYLNYDVVDMANGVSVADDLNLQNLSGTIDFTYDVGIHRNLHTQTLPLNKGLGDSIVYYLSDLFAFESVLTLEGRKESKATMVYIGKNTSSTTGYSIAYRNAPFNEKHTSSEFMNYNTTNHYQFTTINGTSIQPRKDTIIDITRNANGTLTYSAIGTVMTNFVGNNTSYNWNNMSQQNTTIQATGYPLLKPLANTYSTSYNGNLSYNLQADNIYLWYNNKNIKTTLQVSPKLVYSNANGMYYTTVNSPITDSMYEVRKHDSNSDYGYTGRKMDFGAVDYAETKLKVTNTNPTVISSTYTVYNDTEATVLSSTASQPYITASTKRLLTSLTVPEAQKSRFVTDEAIFQINTQGHIYRTVGFLDKTKTYTLTAQGYGPTIVFDNIDYRGTIDNQGKASQFDIVATVQGKYFQTSVYVEENSSADFQILVPKKDLVAGTVQNVVLTAVKAVDAHTKNITVAKAYTIDHIKPTVSHTIQNATDGTTDKYIILTASDSSGILSIEDPEGNKHNRTTYTYKAIYDGDYIFKVTDFANNTLEYVVTIGSSGSNEIRINSNLLTNWVKGPHTFEFEVLASPHLLKEVYINDALVKTFTGKNSIEKFTHEFAGGSNFIVKVKTTSGLERSLIVNGRYVDSNAPTVKTSIDEQAEIETTESSYWVDVTSLDSQSGVFLKKYILSESIDKINETDSRWQDFTSGVNFNENGRRYLHLKVTDLVGNETYKVVGPLVRDLDLNAPKIHMSVEGYSDKELMLHETDDKLIKINVRVDDDSSHFSKMKFRTSKTGSFTEIIENPITFTKSYADLKPGEQYTIYFEAMDEAGNKSNVTRTFIYGLSAIDDDKTPEIGKEITVGGITWVHMGNMKYVSKTPVGSLSLNNKTSKDAYEYLNGEFLKILNTRLTDIEKLYLISNNWKYGNDLDENAVEFEGKIGLLTKTEYQSLFDVISINNAWTSTESFADSDKQWKMLSDNRVVETSKSDNLFLHPVIKLMNGIIFDSGGNIDEPEGGGMDFDISELLDKLTAMELRMFGIEAVNSMNKLTSGIDGRVYLIVDKINVIDMQVSAGNLNNRVVISGDSIMIDISGLSEDEIPEYIWVNGYLDGKLVSQKRIFKKDFYYKAIEL